MKTKKKPGSTGAPPVHEPAPGEQSAPKPQIPDHRAAMLAAITAAGTNHHPPFLPVQNPDFTKCSHTLAELCRYQPANSRHISLPSCALPLLP